MPFKPDNVRLLESLPKHHDGRFGYVVYRVAYGDDARWKEFLKNLDAHAQARFNYSGAPQELRDNLVWDLREDEAQLSGASKSTVRRFRMFSEWVRSVDGSCNLTRYAACLYVDEEVMRSVIEDEDPNDNDYRLIDRPKAFVKLINELFDEKPVQWSKNEIRDDEQREKCNAGDEGHPPIEGDRRYDVGWMKSSARWLIPVTYLYMGNGLWDQVYVRPPKISNGGG